MYLLCVKNVKLEKIASSLSNYWKNSNFKDVFQDL